MTYPHDELIRAWLDGQAVQYLDKSQSGELIWMDMPSPDKADKLPHFYRTDQYRLKPQTVRVRHALMRSKVGGSTWINTATDMVEESVISKEVSFIKWLDDWTELTA